MLSGVKCNSSIQVFLITWTAIASNHARTDKKENIRSFIPYRRKFAARKKRGIYLMQKYLHVTFYHFFEFKQILMFVSLYLSVQLIYTNQLNTLSDNRPSNCLSPSTFLFNFKLICTNQQMLNTLPDKRPSNFLLLLMTTTTLFKKRNTNEHFRLSSEHADQHV